MKTPKHLAIIGALLVSLNGYSQGTVVFAPGTVVFANSADTAVIDGMTGLPALAGLYRVGLYYSASLSVVPDPFVPDNIFRQVGAFANVIGGGIFIGGTRTITEVTPGTEVLFLVRGWSASFTTYEEAYNARLAGSVKLGASRLMRIATGGGALPTPSLVVQGGLQSFAVGAPEPSTIALFFLGGLGALVLLRRKPFVARPR